MRRSLLLMLLWPALTAAWEEEPAIAFILAHNPVSSPSAKLRRRINRPASRAG